MKKSQLEEALTQIYETILDKQDTAEKIAAAVHPDFRMSARNLYRYLILRNFDLRKIHDTLSDLGLSSLRSAEGYVLSNVTNVLRLIKLLRGEEFKPVADVEMVNYKQSQKLLRLHTNSLFKEKRKKHSTDIMVTLPTEAATDIDLIRNLAKEGMEIARINLSHDGMEVWENMVTNIKAVRKELGVNLKIYMDLSGPKIRTSEIQIGGVDKKKKSVQNFITLAKGDQLVLTKKETKGRQVTMRDNDKVRNFAEIGLMLPQIIDDLKVDDTVYFDDGMIKARVVSKTEEQASLEITKAYKSKLSTHKGINLPDTRLHLDSLTERDIELLPYICRHADMVGYSFVRTASDVRRLYEELAKNGKSNIGVVFKIENREAFQNLPLILFEAMKRPKIGVMIARGDLAVEIGYERISEVQSEIMWLCEAAHIPVIWATQVLDNLAKTGIATRAEVSDAAISAQAECVMLNKGKHILDAVRTLRVITRKMEAHASKKKSRLRPLKVAKRSLKKVNKQMD
ncbi:MAG: pyruvate kinase [Bacteroidia bacterium]